MRAAPKAGQRGGGPHECHAGRRLGQGQPQPSGHRQRHVLARQLLGEDPPDPLLVLGPDEAVEQADRDGVDIEVPQPPSGFPNLRLVQRLLDPSVVADPLGDLQPASTSAPRWSSSPP